LGLVGLVLVIPAIWEALQSQFMPPTIVLACVLLGVGGAMAGMVWVECYCRQTTGEACYRGRVWRDSRNIAILVFSMVAVIEILLDRFAKVVSQ
jgi:hypothetical protein